MYETMKQLSLQGLRQRHPDVDEAELRRRLADLVLGPALMEQITGYRLHSPDTPFEKLAYAHEHYDHAAVDADPQVLLPLDHLRGMTADGRIGALTAVVSFMGYQPDVSRLLDETIPAILEVTREEKAQAALLVPA